MMCENPFVRLPTGLSTMQALVNRDAMLAATPFGCGRCLPCRINKGRIITTRLLLENMTHETTTFTTLTFDDDHLPIDVSRDQIQRYIKRLRKAIEPKKLRYYAVGEYGEKTGRPHYHAMLFGLDPINDAEVINAAWNPRGFTYNGECNLDTARYVSGYIIKGWTFDGCRKLNGRTKEFASSSRNNPGGIGLPGIIEIAEKIKRSGYDFSMLRQINIGRKSWPLGRYLTTKLSELLGLSTEFIEQQVNKYCMEKIIESSKGEKVYKDQIIDEKRVERGQQKNRLKIFGKARTI